MEANVSAGQWTAAYLDVYDYYNCKLCGVPSWRQLSIPFLGQCTFWDKCFITVTGITACIQHSVSLGCRLWTQHTLDYGSRTGWKRLSEIPSVASFHQSQALSLKYAKAGTILNCRTALKYSQNPRKIGFECSIQLQVLNLGAVILGHLADTRLAIIGHKYLKEVEMRLGVDSNTARQVSLPSPGLFTWDDVFVK